MIGVIYSLISRYILPVFRITSVTNDRLRQMQEQMNAMNQKVDDNTRKKRVKKDGDYIDYEEVK